ncbi:MAG: hypothetical protein QXL89_09850 [Nitrososphaeria archaeon]
MAEKMLENGPNDKTSDIGEKDLPSVGQLEQTLSAYMEVRAAVDGFFKDKIEAIEGAIEAQKKAEEAKRKDPKYMHLELTKPNNNPGPYYWLNRELMKAELKGHISGLRIEFKDERIEYEFTLVNLAKRNKILGWFKWVEEATEVKKA